MSNMDCGAEFLESILGKIDKKIDIEKLGALGKAVEIALGVVYLAGIGSVVLLAPNLLSALDKLYFRKNNQSYSKKEKVKRAYRTFYYLKEKGLIDFKKEKMGWKVFLTNKGRDKAIKLNFKTLKVSKPKDWNGRWWLVAADIPTKEHRAEADALRRKLKEMDFCSLQRTMWLHPFDPRKEIQFLCDTFNLGRFVTVMEVSRLDKQDEVLLKKHFKFLKI